MSQFSPDQAPDQVQDQVKDLADATGYTLPGAGPFRRIVSLVPSLTELLLDLGVNVVGRTRFCIHPGDRVRGIASVGGTKDFRLDAIRALKPDLVIANLEENVAEPLLALRQELPVWTTRVRDLAEALGTISTLGRLSGRQSQAEALRARIAAGFEALPRRAAPLRTLYLIWRGPWMSVGGDTFIHDLLQRAGFASLTAQALRYPSLSDDEIAALAPDLILLASEPYPFKARHIPELAALCPRARIELVDGSYFSWYGSRLAPAADYLAEWLTEAERQPDNRSSAWPDGRSKGQSDDSG